MRRIRYAVAMSLDGYIAGPNGEADWIIMDPDIDFGALISEFDTVIMGRGTFDGLGREGQVGPMFGLPTYVFSRTLAPERHADVTVVADGHAQLLHEMRAASGKDIWLFGGGQLFRSLAAEALVDTVEVAVVPVLLGNGIPLYPAPAPQTTLRLTGHRLYDQSGVMSLQYAVEARTDGRAE